MPKAIIISGYLTHLSDNIIPFLDNETDIYCHTWDTEENFRWVAKLNRYKRYCKDIRVVVDQPKFDKKLYSYFYSTYKAANLIQDIDRYERIIKFKPNLEGDISYVGDTKYYFEKAYFQTRPFLDGWTKEEGMYGTVHYQTMDERMFTTYPLAISRMFHILEEEFIEEMINIDTELMKDNGSIYEGSIFWMTWAKKHNVVQIQDLDLRIPNSIKYE